MANILINTLLALIPGATSYFVFRYGFGAPEWASYSLALVVYELWYLHYQIMDKIKVARHG